MIKKMHDQEKIRGDVLDAKKYLAPCEETAETGLASASTGEHQQIPSEPITARKSFLVPPISNVANGISGAHPIHEESTRSVPKTPASLPVNLPLHPIHTHGRNF